MHQPPSFSTFSLLVNYCSLLLRTTTIVKYHVPTVGSLCFTRMSHNHKPTINHHKSTITRHHHSSPQRLNSLQQEVFVDIIDVRLVLTEDQHLQMGPRVPGPMCHPTMVLGLLTSKLTGSSISHHLLSSNKSWRLIYQPFTNHYNHSPAIRQSLTNPFTSLKPAIHQSLTIIDLL